MYIVSHGPSLAKIKKSQRYFKKYYDAKSHYLRIKDNATSKAGYLLQINFDKIGRHESIKCREAFAPRGYKKQLIDDLNKMGLSYEFDTEKQRRIDKENRRAKIPLKYTS